MDSELVRILDSVGVGTAIIIISGILSFVFTIYRFVMFVKTKIDEKMRSVEEETADELQQHREEEEMKKTVTELKNRVNDLSDKIDTLTDLISTESETSTTRSKDLQEALEREQKRSTEQQIEMNNSIADLRNIITTMNDDNSKMRRWINYLIKSDAARIKSFITEEWHKHSVTGEIDTLTMASIEQEFMVYDQEYHMNTYVHGCMEELRKLKKVNNTPTDNNELIHYISLYSAPSAAPQSNDNTNNTNPSSE